MSTIKLFKGDAIKSRVFFDVTRGDVLNVAEVKFMTFFLKKKEIE